MVTYIQPLSPCLLASGSVDNTAIIWNNDGRYMWHLTGHYGTVTSFGVLTPDKITTGSTDQTISVWKFCGCTPWSVNVTAPGTTTAPITTTSGLRNRVFLGHTGPVYSVDRIDQNMFITGSSDKTLKVWSYVNGSFLYNLTGNNLTTSSSICVMYIFYSSFPILFVFYLFK